MYSLLFNKQHYNNYLDVDSPHNVTFWFRLPSWTHSRQLLQRIWMSTRDFAAPVKRRPGRPPHIKGKGGPATYVPSNTNVGPNNNNSPIQTPPRSPSEASLASSRDIVSDGVLSPLNSPQPVLQPEPVPHQLPENNGQRPNPKTPPAGFKAPPPVTPAAKQPPQPNVAANAAMPSGQDYDRLRQQVENLAESNRRHRDLLTENTNSIRQMRADMSDTNQLLQNLIEKISETPQREDPNIANGSTSRSRSDPYSSGNITNVRPFNNTGSNAQNQQDSDVRRVLEDKHIPPAITKIKSPVSNDIVHWIEKLQAIARNQRWTDADIRQVFLFRTEGTLNDFLFKELDISTMTFAQIVNAIFTKWNNIDRIMINTHKLQNTRMNDGETVEEYYERFLDVANRVTNKSDFDKMISFIDGLTEELREHMVKNSHPKDLDSAYNAAQNAESWRALFKPKKPVTKKETIYQVIRPVMPQRPPIYGSHPGNSPAPRPVNFNTPKPYTPKTPSMPYTATPKTPAPTSANSKYNYPSAVRRLDFTTPQHNNIEEVETADAAASTGPQDEVNNVEESYYIVDDGAPEPGNDLLEEH